MRHHHTKFPKQFEATILYQGYCITLMMIVVRTVCLNTRALLTYLCSQKHHSGLPSEH